MKKYKEKKLKEKKKGTPKLNNKHGRGTMHGTFSRAEKRSQEAVARNRARSERTNAQQIARLDAGNYVAKRERARLSKVKRQKRNK
jgi:hypothetical protein